MIANWPEKLRFTSRDSIDMIMLDRVLRTVLVLLIVGLIIMGGGLLIGVWPPDGLSMDWKVVAVKKSESGDIFAVVQRLTLDFYLSKFCHVTPDGRVYWVLLDPDGNKLWSHATYIESVKGESRAVLSFEGREVLRYDYGAKKLVYWGLPGHDNIVELNPKDGADDAKLHRLLVSLGDRGQRR